MRYLLKQFKLNDVISCASNEAEYKLIENSEHFNNVPSGYSNKEEFGNIQDYQDTYEPTTTSLMSAIACVRAKFMEFVVDRSTFLTIVLYPIKAICRNTFILGRLSIL